MYGAYVYGLKNVLTILTHLYVWGQVDSKVVKNEKRGGQESGKW